MGFFDSDLFHPGRWGESLARSFGVGSGDPANPDRDALRQQGDAAGRFADTSQQEYTALGGDAANQRAYLGRLAAGQDSVSAEQLRQGVQQNQATQMSMAAGATPQNAAGAARTAAIQAGRIGTGMAGQQAIAGLQERQNAQRQLAEMIMQQRAQAMQGALGSRQNANQGYGTALGTPQKSSGQMLLGGLTGAAGLGAMSDRRLKRDIADGDDDANKAIKGLRAYVFKYKNERDGAGKQTGIMAQDLERVGLKHAVIDTPDGKMVHGAKLATANTAMISALGRRLAKLEDKDA